MYFLQYDVLKIGIITLYQLEIHIFVAKFTI